MDVDPTGESCSSKACAHTVDALSLKQPHSDTAPKTPPNHPESVPKKIPFTPEPNENIEKAVNKFVIHLRSTFGEFIRNDTQLPLWEPPPLNIADETRGHLIDLKIPTASQKSPFPLLLLHNLGQPSHDPHLAKRVEGLFHSDLK